MWSDTRYHWGFLIGPKIEDEPEVPGVRYHVKNHPLGGWVYEEKSLPNVQSTISLLARILIAKVEDERRLIQILRETPVIQGDPNWRCRTWVQAVLVSIRRDGRAVGTSNLSWAQIEPWAREYVARKTESGRYSLVQTADLPKPTWDMLEDKEIVP